MLSAEIFLIILSIINSFTPQVNIELQYERKDIWSRLEHPTRDKLVLCFLRIPMIL